MALSADAPLRFLGEAKSEIFTVDSAAASQIWKGEGIVLNIGGGDTLNVVGAGTLTLVDNDVFVGIAAHSKYTKLGDREADALLEVYVEPSIIGFKDAVLTDASDGLPIYMSDTATLTTSNGAYPRIGNLFKVEDGYAYVALITPFVLNVP